ncbi:MAG: hypothetical protein M3Y29_01225, partial [Chloroflexota bacterium]|nr:hypothetical protein [Chloroflexota bacterium]
MGRRTSTLAGWIARHGVLAAYAVVAIGAYPIAEYLAAGTGALVYAVDVFDDGSVSRLGALAPAWREHGLTLWNPLLTGGNAWFSQFALPPIAPDSLLTLLLTPFQAFFTVQLALPVVAGLGMHVFARRSLRLPPVAALVGGSVYALSLWHYPIGLAGPAVPLMLTVVDQRPRRLASATAAHAGLLVLVIHQGLLQIALLAALLQLGWIAGGLPPARRRTALG